MAHLVRVSRTYHHDASGRRVPKGTKGAKKVRERDPRWYGQGIPGLPPKKRVPLASDKAAARRMLEEMVRKAEQGQAGVPDRDAARKPLADHLGAFRDDMALGLSAKGGKKRRAPSAEQVKLVVQRVRDLLAGCGLKYPTDLDAGAPAKAAKYLTDRRAKPRKEGGISAQTAEFHVSAARRFVRWLSRKAAVPADLFDGLPSFDPKNERVHARREVSPVELARILTAARDSARDYRGLLGPDRYHLYLTAFATGYRSGELAELLPENFHLDDEPPSVTLPGKLTKNKKHARQPLPPGVASQLRSYLTGKPDGKPVWGGTWAEKPAKMLRVDLKAANVPYVVEGPHGKLYADFHALRHSYVSALAAAGVGARELQELARHSDPRLTLGVYTHARADALGEAVGRLQLPGSGGENPLGALSRADLETAVVGLLGLVASLLNPAYTLRTPPRTPPVGTTGDNRGRPDTQSGDRASA